MLGFEKIPAEVKAKSFYDLKANLPGKDRVFDFAELKGKPVLIVNTASKWYVCLVSPAYQAHLGTGWRSDAAAGRERPELTKIAASHRNTPVSRSCTRHITPADWKCSGSPRTSLDPRSRGRMRISQSSAS